MHTYDNYHYLFDEYLHKIKSGTVSKFGSLSTLQTFLHHLPEQGSILLAARACERLKISPPEIIRLAKRDRYLAKCIDLAKTYAAEMVEAVLYDRAINGYEELTFNKDGECVARKRKYCTKSLLEYLKANSIKYQPQGKNSEGLKEAGSLRRTQGEEQPQHDSPEIIPSFEIKSYEESQETAR